MEKLTAGRRRRIKENQEEEIRNRRKDNQGDKEDEKGANGKNRMKRGIQRDNDGDANGDC